AQLPRPREPRLPRYPHEGGRHPRGILQRRVGVARGDRPEIGPDQVLVL
ncbi:MAG: hypothetical protein AVDCRST_MAG05-2966, partial [uncultured Rubrobacteraceae bacterium]